VLSRFTLSFDLRIAVSISCGSKTQLVVRLFSRVRYPLVFVWTADPYGVVVGVAVGVW